MFADAAIAGYRCGQLKPGCPPSRALLAVRHDMAGGYHHDADSFGHHMQVGKQLPLEYFVAYWPLVDIFMYFSHDLISIPPVQWIEAAHRTNTLVLGTLITEHEQGTALTHKMIDDAWCARWWSWRCITASTDIC